MRAIVWVGIFAFLAMPLATAQGGETEDNPADAVEYTFDKEGITIEQAIVLAEEALGIPFVYSSNETSTGAVGQVKLQGKVTIPRDGLQEFWQGIFSKAGFAMIPLDHYIIVENFTTSQIIKSRATFVPHTNLVSVKGKIGEVVMTSIPLRYIQVAPARAAISGLLPTGRAGPSFVQEVASANSLLIVGFGPTVFGVSQVLEAMDVQPTGLVLKFEKLTLEHAVAEELAPIITELIQSSATTPGAAPVIRPNQPGVALEGLPGQEAPEPKILSEPRTNSLLIYAVDSDLREIQRLVATLDTEITEPDSNIRVYPLENSTASDIEATLRDVLEGGQNRTGGGVRGGNAGPTVIGEANQDVTITADDNSNSLIIQATRTRYREVVSIIEQLDRRRPQVLVETAIVELAESDLNSIAVELTALQGGDGYRGGFATGFGLSSIADTGTGGTTSLLDGLARVPVAATTDGGFRGLVAGIFEDEFNIPLLLQLVGTYDASNLLSNASVLTNDNEGASIVVGETVFFQQFATTTAGADRTTADSASAALTLSISPQISSDSYLKLDIDLIVDAFVGSPDPTSGVPPNQTNRSYSGIVTVENGKTVVVGGLVRDNQTVTEEKVPYLSDIPLIGEIFKSRGKSTSKTILYLFVTPTIITDFRTLDDISYAKKLEILKLEGNIGLVDPNFRAIGIEQAVLDYDRLEASGALDLPQYRPVSAFTERVRNQVNGAQEDRLSGRLNRRPVLTPNASKADPEELESALRGQDR